MNNNFSYLKGLFNLLSLNFDVEKEGILNILKQSPLNFHIDEVKEDLDQAFSDPTFDWIALALEKKVLYEGIKSEYTNKDVIYDMNDQFWDYLYPEKALTKEELEMLSRIAVEILQNERKDEGWVLQSEIGKILEQRYPKFNAINTFILDDLVERRIILRRRNEGMDPNGFMRHNYSLKIAPPA